MVMRVVCAVLGGLATWQAWGSSSPAAVGHYLLGCAMICAAGVVLDWMVEQRGGGS